jgi:Mrp family chromosome partitioning ATPase
VLLDSPPTLAVTDPAILAAYCDGVVLVVRSRKTSLVQARRMRQIMTDLGAPVVGVVLNSADLARQGYGYGYGYGYGRDPAELAKAAKAAKVARRARAR